MKAMTPEEWFERIQRQFEFLASNQAQHDTRLAEIDARLAESARLNAENSRQIAEHTVQIGQLSDLVLRLGRVVEVQAQRTDESLRELAQSQRRTDERLNTLINVVERYFSNGHQ